MSWTTFLSFHAYHQPYLISSGREIAECYCVIELLNSGCLLKASVKCGLGTLGNQGVLAWFLLVPPVPHAHTHTHAHAHTLPQRVLFEELSFLEEVYPLRLAVSTT